jgi:hypothetical protein
LGTLNHSKSIRKNNRISKVKKWVKWGEKDKIVVEGWFDWKGCKNWEHSITLKVLEEEDEFRFQI